MFPLPERRPATSPARTGSRSAVLAKTCLLGAAVLLTGCGATPSRGTTDLEVRVRVAPDPPLVGGAELRMNVTDASWRPVNGADVTVTGRWSGGGEPMRSTAVGQGAGQYVVEAFNFGSAGEWTLTVRVDLAGGDWTESDHLVTVEAAP